MNFGGPPKWRGGGGGPDPHDSPPPPPPRSAPGDEQPQLDLYLFLYLYQKLTYFGILSVTIWSLESVVSFVLWLSYYAMEMQDQRLEIDENRSSCNETLQDK